MAFPLSNSAPSRKVKSAIKDLAVRDAFAVEQNARSRASLANNRRIGDGLLPRGFQDSLKREVNRSTDAFEDKYLSNADALAFSSLKDKSVVLEGYILSSIVSKMEANTDFFPKDKTKVVAGNCGKRVMPSNLRSKIFGEPAQVDYYTDFSSEIPRVVSNLNHKASFVDVIEYKGSFSYSGVMCCHNTWACPVCGRKLSERRKRGLSLLLNSHFDKFGSDTVLASLFTIPHSKYDDLSDILKRLNKAYSDMTHSRGYKSLIKSFGGCGSSKAKEATWSLVNGFHPHLHVLNFFEDNLLLHHQFIADTLFNLWADALKKNCFDSPSRKAFGCNLVPSTKAGIEAVADYFSKSESDINDADIMGYIKKHKDVRSVTNAQGREIIGWSTEHEMTKWHLKQARADGENFRYSMMDFIRGYSISDDNNDTESKAQFRALWLNYRIAFKGERQLWTRHKHFKIAELTLSDEELANQELEEPEKKTVLSIEFNQWLVIVFMHARGTLLERIRKRGSDSVADYFQLLNKSYGDFFPDDPCGFFLDS